MTPDRYLELIERDGLRLADAAAAGDLGAAIESCPGWDVGACVVHTGGVFNHKVACIRLRREPDEDEARRTPDPGVDPVDWYRAALDGLLDELRAHAPGDPAHTWFAPDQTVGFWIRRMAQEVAVHRRDVEDGRGDTTPIDPELALDGIDEVLAVFLGYDWGSIPLEWWRDVDPHAGEGRTVAVRAGGQVWRCTLGPDAVDLSRDDGPADATVEGDAESVLLWLWGRLPDDAVALGGDGAALQPFRDRLNLAID